METNSSGIGWLDRLPRLWRHLIIQLLACLLAWAASDLVPALRHEEGYAAIIGALLGQVLLIVTPLVRSYAAFMPHDDGENLNGRHEA